MYQRLTAEFQLISQCSAACQI